MFPNLRAEMARQNLTAKDVAKIIGKTEKSARDKLSGKREFTYRETCSIRDAFFPETPIETLFERVPAERGE